MQNDIILILTGGILTLIGAIGGAFLNHSLEKKRGKEKRLFESRRIIYSEALFFMRSFDAYNGYVQEKEKEWKILGEARLLAGKNLRKLIIFHQESRELFKTIIKKRSKMANMKFPNDKEIFFNAFLDFMKVLDYDIEQNMRQEIGIDDQNLLPKEDYSEFLEKFRKLL